MESIRHRHWRHQCAVLVAVAVCLAAISFGVIAFGAGAASVFTGALIGTESRAAPRTATAQAAFEPRCAHAVVRFSTTEKSSYMPIAINPTTTRPENARPICIDEPAEISR